MSKAVELKFDVEKINNNKKKLSELYKKTVNRKIRVKVINSKGDCAEKINNYIDSLNNLNEAVAVMIMNTQNAVDAAIKRIEEADKDTTIINSN